MASLVALLIDALAFGGIYALVAVGFSLILKSSRVTQFGAGYVGLAGGVLFVHVVGHAPGLLGLLGSLALGALLGAVLWLVVVWLAERLGGTETTMSLAALAAGLLIGGIVDEVTKGAEQATGPLVAGYFSIGGSQVQWESIITIAIAAVALAVVYWVTSRTLYGRAMTAVSTAQDLAQTMGIRTSKVVLGGWVLATAVMALAGALLAPLYAETSAVSLPLALQGFTGAIIGGVDRPLGAALGAISVAIVSQLFTRYVSANWSDLFLFGLLFVVLAVCPGGIGRRRARQA